MTREDLLDRIAKKEEVIKKIEKRIEKWQSSLTSEKALRKRYDWLTDEQFNARLESLREDWIDSCNDEIKRAEYDLKDANITIEKYKNALLLLDEKESKPVIKIFKDFFDRWKNEINEFANMMYKKYLEANSEYCDCYNHYRGEDRKDKLAELDKKQKELRNITWVRLRSEKSNSDFCKYLDKYMEDRYYELVEKVTSIVGGINDITSLYIGNDGSINGIIIGENGKAKVETITAGGYNVQCLHYRVLVHKLK